MFERNNIEDIKRNLYDPNDHSVEHQRVGVLHRVTHEVPKEWQDDQNKTGDNMNNKFKKPPMSPFKKFFLISAIFFIGALGFAVYKFSSNDTSVTSDKINIEVIGNSFTKGGDILPLQIEITNKNSASLELANLIVEYPKGAEDDTANVVRLPKDSIGTIKAGETVIRNIEVKLYGEEKSIRNIKVSLDYHPQGSNATFTKDKYYPVTISLAPISINIVGPSETTSNQMVSFTITTSLNTSLSSDSNPILQVTYPNNFVFDSATPSPIFGNSVWDISSVSTAKPITVEIKGRIIGQEGEEQIFHAYAGTSDSMDQSEVSIVYSSILQKILITKPFLDAKILVNGRDEETSIVSGGQNVTAQISWANNLSTRITDGQIIVSLSGNAFDKTTVDSSNGFYDSINNQIIWDKTSVPDFAEINPGQSGTVSFNFKPLSLVGSSTALRNPQISIKVSIKGRQPLLGSTYSDVNNFSEKIIKILSDFQIVSSAAYGSGSIPPKAETETKYVVTWTLSNSANSITGASARSVLPIYVNWVGLYLGAGENVTYNEVTREVIWNIGSVVPNTGITTNREISFIISIKPSLAQVGSVPQLMKEVSLSGTDSFTGTAVKTTYSSIMTSSASGGDGRVVQ